MAGLVAVMTVAVGAADGLDWSALVPSRPSRASSSVIRTGIHRDRPAATADAAVTGVLGERGICLDEEHPAAGREDSSQLCCSALEVVEVVRGIDRPDSIDRVGHDGEPLGGTVTNVDDRPRRMPQPSQTEHTPRQPRRVDGDDLSAGCDPFGSLDGGRPKPGSEVKEHKARVRVEQVDGGPVEVRRPELTSGADQVDGGAQRRPTPRVLAQRSLAGRYRGRGWASGRA